MKKTMLKMLVLPALLAFGCDDSGNPKNNDGSATDAAKGGADLVSAPDMTPPAPPPMPALGTQIDRMARATINVAVTDPFDLDGKRDMIRDQYNQDSDPTMWVANWQPRMQGTLALYDGADTKCGNQLAADATKTDPTRYAPLAGLLANDRLWLNTASTMCAVYLGVELNATGIFANTDCGGRTPTQDVIDIMYTAATTGPSGFMAGGTYAVTDGIAKDPDGTVDLTTFPFLAAPNM